MESYNDEESYNMSYEEEPVQDSNDIIRRLKEEICSLKKKQESYDECIAERNELRCLYKQFEEWKAKNEREYKKVMDEMMNTLVERTKKLNKYENSEMPWKKKCDELQNQCNCLEDHLNSMRVEDTDLQMQLVDSEKEKKCLQKDLCSIKTELANKTAQIEKLISDLKCKEEELCKARKQCDECRNKRCRLDEMNKILEVDLERANKNLCDEKARAKYLEEKCRCELDSLKDQLKAKCQKSCEMESKLDSMCHQLNEAQSKVKLLTKSLKDLKEASEKSLCNMKDELQKLKAEMNVKDDEICQLRKHLKDLQRENEFKELELHAQKNKLYEKDCQLKQMKMLSEKIGQIKSSVMPCPPPPTCCRARRCEKPPISVCGTAMADSSSDICCNASIKPNCSCNNSSNSDGNSNSNCSLKTELKKMNCQLEDLKKDVCEMRKNKC